MRNKINLLLKNLMEFLFENRTNYYNFPGTVQFQYFQLWKSKLDLSVNSSEMYGKSRTIGPSPIQIWHGNLRNFFLRIFLERIVIYFWSRNFVEIQWKNCRKIQEKKKRRNWKPTIVVTGQENKIEGS
jgi:hypothetical protein